MDAAHAFCRNYEKLNPKRKIEGKKFRSSLAEWVSLAMDELKINLDGSFMDGRHLEGSVAGVCQDHRERIVDGFARSV